MPLTSSTVSLPSDLPNMALERLAAMTDAQREVFVEEYDRRAKSLFAAYVCWLMFGLHYLYLKRWGAQLVFWLTVGGFFFWWIADFVRMPFLVRAYNQTVAVDVLKDQAVLGL